MMLCHFDHLQHLFAQYLHCYKFGELWKRIINSTTEFPDTLDRLAKADTAAYGNSCKKRRYNKKISQQRRRGNCALPYDHCAVNRTFLCMWLSAAKYHPRRLYVDVDFSLGWLCFSSVTSSNTCLTRTFHSGRMQLPTIRRRYTAFFRSQIVWWISSSLAKIW